MAPPHQVRSPQSDGKGHTMRGRVRRALQGHIAQTISFGTAIGLCVWPFDRSGEGGLATYYGFECSCGGACTGPTPAVVEVPAHGPAV